MLGYKRNLKAEDRAGFTLLQKNIYVTGFTCIHPVKLFNRFITGTDNLNTVIPAGRYFNFTGTYLAIINLNSSLRGRDGNLQVALEAFFGSL